MKSKTLNCIFFVPLLICCNAGLVNAGDLTFQEEFQHSKFWPPNSTIHFVVGRRMPDTVGIDEFSDSQEQLLEDIQGQAKKELIRPVSRRVIAGY